MSVPNEINKITNEQLGISEKPKLVPIVFEKEVLCRSYLHADGFGEIVIRDEWLQRFIGKRVLVRVEENLE